MLPWHRSREAAVASNVRLSGSQTSARSESDVRINQKNQKIIIGASNNLSFNPQAQFYSNDGGQTWSQSNLPAVTGDQNQSDPCVGWTPDGTAWALTVGVGSSNVVRSFTSATGNGGWTYDSVVSGSQTNVDKPNLWVDQSTSSPYTGNLYALWWNLDSPVATYVSVRVGLSGSWGTPVQVSGSETPGGSDGGDIKTNAFGDVFAFWPSESSQELYVAKSTDGGTSFGTPVKIADTYSSFLYHVPADEPSRGTLLYITAGAYRTATVNMVYAIWMDLDGSSTCNSTADMPGTNAASTCKTRIWFSKSADGGATWSSPIKINDQPNVGGKPPLNDQFFPRLAVDQTSGALVVVYYDTINDPNRVNTDIWMQSSLDNGNTWSGASQITTAETNETTPGFNTYQYGDYIGLDGHAGQFFACWTDRRSGSFEEIWGAPIVIADLEFKIQKSTFSEDEVALTASYPSAYWLTITGVPNSGLGFNTPSDLNNTPNPLPSIVASIDPALNPTLTAAQIATIGAPGNLPVVNALDLPILATDPTLALELQTFWYPFTVSFPNSNAFAALNLHQSAVITLSATFNVGLLTLTTSAPIDLTKGEDPFFYDYNPANPTEYPSWLSFDLRFFSVTPNQSHQWFSVANPADASQAVGYIQKVLHNLNTPGAITNGDTFDSLTQDEDLSAVEYLPTNSSGDPVFSFAVARLRIKAASKTTISPVRVFFRLFQAASTVSNFIEVGTGEGTYRWGTDGTTGHKIPLLGVQTDQNGNLEYVTIPCFAKERVNLTTPTNMNQQTDPSNAVQITTTAGAELDTFFGCWLDVNQTGHGNDFLIATPPSAQSQWDGPWPGALSINGVIQNAPHQCLIAEIRYDDTPIPTNATTATSDKLAQRNIAWIDGPNPGANPSRIMTHPFEVRASASNDAPDELMLTWGKTMPSAATGVMYLPAVQSSDIIALADRFLGGHRLSVVDAHTIQCPASGVAVVPIPKGTGRYAGLFSINLPPGITRGDSYTVSVRQFERVTITAKLPPPPPPPPPAPKIEIAKAAPFAEVINTETYEWRQLLGAFQYTINISTKEQLLYPEERLLAWLKWRISVMPHFNRWYPVLLEYLKLIEGHVDGYGGNAGSIPPSQSGQVPGHKPPEVCPPDSQSRRGFIGKVIAIVYDRFGDFEGFTILTESGQERSFRGREHEVEKLVRDAWIERTVIEVFVEAHDHAWPVSIALRRSPPLGV